MVGLYLAPPANTAVFAVDEKPQIKALERTAPVLPMMPGTPERGANLSDASLKFADVFRANLRDAKLADADLSDAGLAGADLSDAYLGDADLGGADLSGADLSEAYLEGTDLTGADLRGADLRRTWKLTKRQVDSARINSRTQLPEKASRVCLAHRC